MQEHSGKTFEVLAHFDHAPLVVEDQRFESCVFDNCTIGPPSSALARTVIRNVELRGCQQRACSISGAVIDSVNVDGLSRLGRIPLFLAGVAFRHTVLIRKIHFFKIQATPWVSPSPEQLTFWNGVNTAFYQDTDWALDISQANFTFSPDLHFVPGELVRIDPTHQAIVNRKAFVGVKVSELEVPGSAMHIALQWFLSDGPYETTALAAGGARKNFDADVRFLDQLRKTGLVAA